VAIQPLLPGERKASWPHADEIVRESGAEEVGISGKLGVCPILHDLGKFFGTIVQDPTPL
jgi:hypothetical protein